jgi:iron complex outermembrane receptor protein
VTGEPIGGALVELEPSGGGSSFFGESDESGLVVIGQLCPGEVRVFAAETGHTSVALDVEISGEITQTKLELVPLHGYHGSRVVVVHDTDAGTIAASEQLSQAELAQTRGDGLAESVSSMAGVSTLGGTGGGMAKPVIRGQVGRRNLIIFDGVRHEGQKWGIDHAPEVDPNAAGRITVIKGAATTRFGSDAIGGAVLVEPLPLPRSPGVGAELSTVGYSNALGGGGAFRVDHAPAKLKGFAWRAQANLTRRRASLTPDYPLDNTGALTWNAGTRVGFLSGPVDVSAGYRVMHLEGGICSCLTISSPEDFEAGIASRAPVSSDAYSPEFQIERPKQLVRHHLAVTRFRADLGRAGELHATYAYQFNDRQEFDVVRSNITGPQLKFQLGSHIGDLRYEHPAAMLGPAWTLFGTVGGEIRAQRNQLIANVSLIPDYEQVGGGLFVVERVVHERVEFELGGRYEGLTREAILNERDYVGQLAGGRLDEGACAQTADGGGRCGHRFDTASASAGALVRPIKALPEFDLRLKLDSAARIPSIDEQFMNGAAPSFPILGSGDSQLGVERTWGGALTARYQGEWLVAEAAGYTNVIDDYILFSATIAEGQCAPLICTSRGPFPLFTFAPVDAFFGGGEASVDVAIPQTPLEFSTNASWVRALNRQDGAALPFVPTDRYRFALRYRWKTTGVSTRGFAEVNGTVVDRQRRFDPETDFSDPPPAYALAGAEAGLEFPVKKMRLSLRGTNLLNRRYRDYNSLLRYFADQPGRGVQLRFSVELGSPGA